MLPIQTSFIVAALLQLHAVSLYFVKSSVIQPSKNCFDLREAGVLQQTLGGYIFIICLGKVDSDGCLLCKSVLW